MEDLAGVGPGSQQRVVAKHPGVAVGGAALVVAVDLADGGIHVDRHRLLAGPGARRPGLGEGVLGGSVQLADVPEGERAQERPQRRRGHDAVAEHGRGGPGAQQVGVVDAVATSHQRVDQGQHLAARSVGTGSIAQIDQLVDDRLDTEPLDQGGRQQQTSVGDRVVVIERHNKPSGAVGG